MVDEILKLYYGDNFSQHGFSKEALGWKKGKQEIRFNQLIKNFNPENKSFIDIGSGLGDFIPFLEKKGIIFTEYLGIEIFDKFYQYSMERFKDNSRIKFINKNFLGVDLMNNSYDYIVGSGIFGHHLFSGNDEKQYEYIGQIIKKALLVAKVGVSFDFLSNKITVEGNKKDFYCDPAKLLDIIYPSSKNLILDNSTMPFEFTLTVFKDETFSKDTILFHSFINNQR